jgi:hypothetical protein
MPDLSSLVTYLQQQGGDGDNLDDYIELIRDLTERIEAGAPEQDEAWSWAQPAWQQSVQSGLTSPGMSPAEYAQAKQQIVQGVAGMTGGTAAERARRGHISRDSMDQYMGGAPAAGAAKGLAELEAKKAKMAREQQERARDALTGTLPFTTAQAEEPQEAYGDLLAEYMGGMPRFQMGAMFSGPRSSRYNRNLMDYNPYDARSTQQMLQRAYSTRGF